MMISTSAGSPPDLLSADWMDGKELPNSCSFQARSANSRRLAAPALAGVDLAATVAGAPEITASLPAGISAMASAPGGAAEAPVDGRRAPLPVGGASCVAGASAMAVPG